MLKKIKQINKVGIYRDFNWEDNSWCFKKYNAFYGFNGSGKSTLARIFQGLNGSNIDYKEAGTKIIFEDHEKNILEVKDEVFHRDVIVYDEEFILNNLKWDQGIKSFVVIGKKSKEDEERLKALHTEKEQVVTDKKITEADIKTLTELIGDLATKISGDLRKELIEYNSKKYNTYNKKPFQAEVVKLKQDDTVFLDRQKIPELKQKIVQISLDEVSIINVLSESIEADIKRTIAFLDAQLPTKNELNYNEREIHWLEVGLDLHQAKDQCLFCENSISQQRKLNIQQDLTSQVAAFIKEGKVVKGILDRHMLKVPAINSKMFYPELKKQFEDVYEKIHIMVDKYSTQIASVKSLVEKKAEFEEIKWEEDKKSLIEIKDQIGIDIQNMNSLIEQNNELTKTLEKQKTEAIVNIENIYFKDFIDQTKELQGKLDFANEKNQQQEGVVGKINSQISLIEASLESAGRAIEGINSMLHVFLGRADIKLEYKKESNKFEITRKGTPAKRLSEGEKTAISVCYFLILVNANPDKKKDLIVVIDDPISSLDTNNLYNAYAVLRNNLNDVKQLFVLTHNLYFFRLVWKWYRDLEEQNSCFKIESTVINNEVSAKIVGLKKDAKETSTEYILLYSHLKEFIKKCERGAMADYEFLPYPNMLRRLLEAYLFTKFPGKPISDFEEILINLGVNSEVARKTDRFCNDFSHARFDAVFGQEGNTLSSAPEIIKSIIAELEKVDAAHFSSMKDLVTN